MSKCKLQTKMLSLIVVAEAKVTKCVSCIEFRVLKKLSYNEESAKFILNRYDQCFSKTNINMVTQRCGRDVNYHQDWCILSNRFYRKMKLSA